MPDSLHGPYAVVGGDVDTGVDVQAGDTIHLISTGSVDFGGSFLGIGAPILSPDGDDWKAPDDYPASYLKKNSLIFEIRGNHPRIWHQGGTNTSTKIPFPENGRLILRTNDSDTGDNSRGWNVQVRVARPEIGLNPNTPALRIVNIEAVQVIQTARNSIPLVAGKNTVIRVFVESGMTGGANAGSGPNRVGNVTGRLTVSDVNGNVLAARIPPAALAVAMPAVEMNRDELSHSLNFRVPISAVITGPARLEVQVWAGGHEGDPPESGLNAATEATVEFRARPIQPILPILIGGPRLGSAPTLIEFTDSLMRGSVRRFPIADTGFLVHPPVSLTIGLGLTTIPEWIWLNSAISTTAAAGWSSPFDGIRCGMVPAAPGTYPVGGIGFWRIGLNIPCFVCVAGSPETFAHEMGHALNMGHARCRGNEPWPVDESLPGRTDDTGFDPAAMRVVRRGTNELMGYCNPPSWPSAVFYRAMLEQQPV